MPVTISRVALNALVDNSAPNADDGSVINKAAYGTFIFDPIDTALSLVPAKSEVLAITGFGTHTFLTGGAGANVLRVGNTTDGAANYARIDLLAGTTALQVYTFPQSYTTSGRFQAGGVALDADQAGGLSIAAIHASGQIRFYTGGTTRRMVIDTTGIVYMDVYGAGTATFNASGAISSVSDERLKDVVGPLGYGLAEVLRLDPIRYRWRIESGLDDPNHTIYGGFGAGAVDAVMPLAIGRNASGMLSLSDRPILGALVNAVKELHARLAAVEART